MSEGDDVALEQTLKPSGEAPRGTIGSSNRIVPPLEVDRKAERLTREESEWHGFAKIRLLRRNCTCAEWRALHVR